MQMPSTNLPRNIAWLAAALVACVAAGCDRAQQSADSAGQKMERAADNAGQKMDQAAEQMKQGAEQAGDKIDDAAITAKVKTALIAEPGLKSLKIDVDTAGGVVTLSGTVDNRRNLEQAARVAQAVEGVKSVDNRLNVKAGA